MCQLVSHRNQKIDMHLFSPVPFHLTCSQFSTIPFSPITSVKIIFQLTHIYTHRLYPEQDALRCLKPTFSLPIPPCLKGSNRTSHLGNKHHPVFAEQTMVPFQPVPGRQAKGQPSNSGPYRSVNILHSFSARKSSSVLKMKRLNLSNV